MGEHLPLTTYIWQLLMHQCSKPKEHVKIAKKKGNAMAVVSRGEEETPVTWGCESNKHFGIGQTQPTIDSEIANTHTSLCQPRGVRPGYKKVFQLLISQADFICVLNWCTLFYCYIQKLIHLHAKSYGRWGKPIYSAQLFKWVLGQVVLPGV